jgi:hypothetical protein
MFALLRHMSLMSRLSLTAVLALLDFWINDAGKPVPTMIMHPTAPALDWLIITHILEVDRALARDPAGKGVS